MRPKINHWVVVAWKDAPTQAAICTGIDRQYKCARVLAPMPMRNGTTELEENDVEFSQIKAVLGPFTLTPPMVPERWRDYLIPKGD